MSMLRGRWSIVSAAKFRSLDSQHRQIDQADRRRRQPPTGLWQSEIRQRHQDAGSGRNRIRTLPPLVTKTKELDGSMATAEGFGCVPKVDPLTLPAPPLLRLIVKPGSCCSVDDNVA